MAHRNPFGSYGKLLDLVAELALDRVDPERIEKRILERKARKQRGTEREEARREEARKEDQSGEHEKNETLEKVPLVELGQSDEEERNDAVLVAEENELGRKGNQNETTVPLPLAEESKYNQGFLRPAYIRASDRRQSHLRDGGKCTFRDPETGRMCGSKYKLEVDHSVPVAQGGVSDLENLQTRCRNHNLWEAVSKLGKETMAPYIDV